MEETTNLKLPLLVPNQSQKEITHNEALIIIDNILQNGIIDKDLITPPENPNTNDMYIVGEGAIGKWEGKDNYLAFYDNGWRFIEPREGFTFWTNDEDKLYTYNGSKWIATIQVGADIENNNSTTPTTPPITKLSELEDVEIIEATQYNILQHNGEKFINTSNLQQLSMVGINTQADENNKLSIKSDYVLFNNNGNSSKIKVNKATSTDTASHLFQTNYGGRAEFGLIGNDDFTLKVSSDGENWNNAFVVDKETGNIDFKGEITKNGESIGAGGSSGDSFPMITTTENAVGQIIVYNVQSYPFSLPPNGTWWVHINCFNNSGVNRANGTYFGIYSGSTTFTSTWNDTAGYGFAIRIQ